MDNTAPTVAITGVPPTSAAPFTATFTFSEAVTGFTVGDITVGNGTPGSFIERTTGTVFTALITPAVTGTVTVGVAAGVATDAAGNLNTAATPASSTYTAPDTRAPRVTSIMRQNPTTSPTNANTLTWRVTFDEDVKDVGRNDFSVTGTTAIITVAEVTASTVYDVTVVGGNLADLNRTVMLSFTSDQDIADLAGNALRNTSPTGTNNNTFIVDNSDAATKELTRRTREWTSRFGSTVAEQVLDAVESRIQASRAPGFDVTLAGESIRPLPRLLFGAEAETSGSDGSELVSGGDAARVQAWNRALTQQDLLLGSSFHVASEDGGLAGGLGGGTVSVWGRGALSRFDGSDNDLTLDGEVTSGMLGADWSRERTLAGLIVGRSTSDGDYQAPEGDGMVSSTVTGVYPWGRHGLTDRIDVWGTVGYGKGTLELTPDGEGAIDADLDMWMVASGLRGTLVDGGLDGFTLTGKTEAMMVETSTAAVAGQLAASEARVTRLRLGLEGSMPVAVGDGQVLTPWLELGLRHDGGDGDTGFGADMGAGIAWTDQQSGINVDLRGRGLLTHAANGFQERGISGSLGWDPAPGSDMGPSLSVTQSFGGASSGGADALLQRSTLASLATNDNGTGANDLRVGRLEARFGYGLPVFGYGWTLTPEVGVSLSDTGRDYSVDWSLVRQVPPGDIGALDISLGARRRENTASADTPEHEATLRMNIRW